jgi:ACS family glucarate transporter-like MFS transporter
VKRFAVVAALFGMSVVFYIDRAAISSTLGPMSETLGLPPGSKGWILGVFAIGYALMQIPSGWMADRWGPRRVLAGAVIGWSLFTGLTGLSWSLASLLVVRFLFGVAEAGGLPASARAFKNWLPVGERGRANGIAFSGMRLGAAISFPLFAWMIPAWGWRSPFLVFAGVGILWGIVWWACFRDHPEPPLPPDPAPAAPPPTFAAVFRTPGMWLNLLQYMAGNFTFFLSITWMLPYLQTRYRLDASTAAGYATLPLLFAAGAMWASGFLIDGLYRTRLRAWSLRLPAALGFALAAGGLLTLHAMEGPGAAVACLTLVMFGADLTIAPSWQYCVDVGAKNSATVSGAMNMAGNLAAALSPVLFEILYVPESADASRYFLAAAAFNAVALFAWLGMRSR